MADTVSPAGTDRSADTDTRPGSRPGGTAALGTSSVARIGYGAMGLERHHDNPDAAVAVVRRAVELGVDHIDTAQFYGNGFVNDVLRRALKPDEGVVIVSKVGAVPDPGGQPPLRPAQHPAELRAAVEDNLRALDTDTIGVVNLRRLDVGPGVTATGDQLVDLDDQLAEMVALRDEGKIGGIGLSAVDTDTLRRALPAGIVCVQNAYSLIQREYEDMLELCADEGIGWAPFFPLGSGFPGFPKVVDEPAVRAAASARGVTPAQVGLAWLLAHAPNILLIPGTASIAHLEENVAVGDIALDGDTKAALDAVGAATVSTGDRSPRWPDEAR
ncbi:aldo/keto reductase [Microlunatus soli]|uniref:Predicted oxidoreductase n=1 Tax=Microlunatus soli TaxID=630515 RepID=A0A1H1ZLV7_9ACTN|nr:aldo/keto reductase [Microlunatus soli]SDT34633.1 Predicted oxidoreductase [Microlunatus soli]